jgi:retron-type reverse transcriptase
MDARAAALWLEVNYKRFSSDVLNGRYTPMPALGFHVTKTSGGFRNLARLTAIDTILQMSLLDTTADYCDTLFSDYSFAYRRGRSTGDALRLYLSMAKEYHFAAKIDVITCFDNMDWSV